VTASQLPASVKLAIPPLHRIALPHQPQPSPAGLSAPHPASHL